MIICPIYQKSILGQRVNFDKILKIKYFNVNETKYRNISLLMETDVKIDLKMTLIFFTFYAVFVRNKYN